MRKAKRPSPLYRRGQFWLDWDRRIDGSLRSPNLAVFWYDPERRRIRSSSTGTADHDQGRSFLDALYLERTSGEAVCKACGQRINRNAGHLVANAIANYQVDHADKLPSANAIAARLAHIVDYIAQLPDPAVICEAVDQAWIIRFRTWAEKQPIVSPKGDERPRSLSTIEGSVAQLSAAINHAHHRGDTLTPARFKAIPGRDLNRTPQHRSPAAEIAAMFRYCLDPTAKTEKMRAAAIRQRSALHRFLMLSVATLGRPDAVLDVSTAVKRRQWNSRARILALNPAGRRQTKKFRATVKVARQVAPHLDDTKGFFVGVKSVRKAWEAMAAELDLPSDGEAGMKLIRRSVADILRNRLPEEAWGEIEIFLGHQKFDQTSDLYAPFKPTYLRRASAEIERLIDEIEELAPGAFHRKCTGADEKVVSMSALLTA